MGRENTYLSRYDHLYFRMLRRAERDRMIDKKGPGKALMIYGKRKPKHVPGSEAARIYALGL